DTSDVGVRIRAHTAYPDRCECLQLRNKLPILVKEFLGLLRTHPMLEHPQLLGVLLYMGQRHLVCSPESFQSVPTDFLRCAPTLWGAQHDHRPTRPRRIAAGAALALILANLSDAVFHRGCHGLVHGLGV